MDSHVQVLDASLKCRFNHSLCGSLHVSAPDCSYNETQPQRRRDASTLRSITRSTASTISRRGEDVVEAKRSAERVYMPLPKIQQGIVDTVALRTKLEKTGVAIRFQRMRTANVQPRTTRIRVRGSDCLPSMQRRTPTTSRSKAQMIQHCQWTKALRTTCPRSNFKDSLCGRRPSANGLPRRKPALTRIRPLRQAAVNRWLVARARALTEARAEWVQLA